MYSTRGGFDGGSAGGGGPDEDPRRAEQSVLAHGLVALAFGFALGLTLLLFAAFLKLFTNPANPIVRPLSSLAGANLLVLFVIGLVAGTVMAGVYNMLVYRKTTLFGVDREFS